ncbi:MAG: NUDIX pyrophosphatase [Clostridiales bacterium]|nr:NUDIX pyrophosphatase [Clostridiales bacterium]
MARAKFQVLVIPFKRDGEKIKFCMFHRTHMKLWQFIAGGGEDNETKIEAAKREAFEEAGIRGNVFYELDTCCSIPANCFKESINWGDECFVVPEYAFAVEINEENIAISHEHSKYEWVDYDTAISNLRYDSNKVALGELVARIDRNLLGKEL